MDTDFLKAHIPISSSNWFFPGVLFAQNFTEFSHDAPPVSLKKKKKT